MGDLQDSLEITFSMLHRREVKIYVCRADPVALAHPRYVEMFNSVDAGNIHKCCNWSCGCSGGDHAHLRRQEEWVCVPSEEFSHTSLFQYFFCLAK